MFIVACTGTQKTSTNPSGPITATGTIVPAELSLTRRGTHTLRIDGIDRYLVESKTMPLQQYDGKEVGIIGTIEANTHLNSLPVIIVSTISAINEETTGQRIWNVPSMNLRITTSDRWQGIMHGGNVSFSLKNSPEVIATVTVASGSTLPDGQSLIIRNRRAVRRHSDDIPRRDVFISDRNNSIHLSLDLSGIAPGMTTEEKTVLISEFDAMVQAVTFLSDASMSMAPPSADSDRICGGSAGLLCDAGYFCNVRDTTTQEGVCRKK